MQEPGLWRFLLGSYTPRIDRSFSGTFLSVITMILIRPEVEIEQGVWDRTAYCISYFRLRTLRTNSSHRKEKFNRPLEL